MYAYLLNQIKMYLIYRLLQLEDEQILGTKQGWNKSNIFRIIDEMGEALLHVSRLH
jgi:hypothetical protein